MTSSSRSQAPPLSLTHVPVGRSVGFANAFEDTMSTKKRKAREKKQDEQDAATILSSFLDFNDKGLDEFCRYLMHCGIGLDDIDYNGGDISAAILEHYRKPDGGYDLAAAAHDFFRWPPITARVKELKRERWQKEAAEQGSR